MRWKTQIMTINFREGQTYWINPKNKLQAVEGGVVCDVPQHGIFNTKFVYDVCHANSDEEARRLCEDYGE